MTDSSRKGPSFGSAGLMRSLSLKYCSSNHARMSEREKGPCAQSNESSAVSVRKSQGMTSPSLTPYWLDSCMSHCAEHMQDDPVRQAEMLVLYATGTQYEYRKVSHGAGKDMRAS